MTPSDPVALLLGRLEGVKKLGTGWTARCPSHADRHNSLKVDMGKEGQALIFCHAGCAFEDVLAALDMSSADLFPPRDESMSQNGHSRRIVATYDYRDERGTLLYQAVRSEPKGFSQRRPDGAGGWVWNLGETRRVLYRLPELLAASSAAWVLVCEGEKDVERLAALGFVATTNAMGAGKWRAEYTALLRGRCVCILPDHDDPGEAHALAVAESLHGVATQVRIQHLPDLPPKGDVSDWLDAGGTSEALALLIAAAPAWEPSGQSQRTSAGNPEPRAARLIVSPLSAIVTQTVAWLWLRWLACGKFHLIGGHAGDGKSTLLAALAAIGSRGGQWPDGSRPPRTLRTLFLLGEDAAADTLRPRLELHDADMEQIFVIETVLDEKGQERFFNIGKHLDLLEAAIVEHRIDWLVIDPLTTIMPGTDRNAEGDTRDSLTPLIKLAERRNVAITGVAHVGKPSGTARRAMQRILGATAFHAMARVVWMISPEENERMVLGVVKSNLAIKPLSLMWSRQEDGPIDWEGVAAQDIEDLLAGAAPSNLQADAEGFLREFLSGGSRSSADVEQAAKARGVAFRTVRRAADAIGIKRIKETGTLSGRWFWRLPDGEPRYADTTTADESSNLATSANLGQVPNPAKLATTEESPVANFGKFEVGHSHHVGQFHETTPNSGGSEVGHAAVDIGQSPEVGQPGSLGVGQVRLPNLANGATNGQLRASANDEAVIAMAKRLAELTPDELNVFRGEVADAPVDDPFVAQDREALALFDVVQAAGKTS